METGMRAAARHTLTMEGRERARLEGVAAVSCFNEQEVILQTAEGEVAIFGSGLHIDQLNLEDGRLDVTGEIAGVEYSAPRTRKERRRLFARKGK
ncbi:MAG: YabP/YqfC family sporulation protein [Clostridia bacterium]|nr:YabP/YqfC family sporulation protein [Clostridia bacterium]